MQFPVCIFFTVLCVHLLFEAVHGSTIAPRQASDNIKEIERSSTVVPPTRATDSRLGSTEPTVVYHTTPYILDIPPKPCLNPNELRDSQGQCRLSFDK